MSARRPGPVRVLYCIDSLAPGGTELQLVELIRRLDRRRVVPALCTLRPSRFDLTTLGCETLELDLPSLLSLAAIRKVRRLHAFVRERRIDIVQTFFQDATIVGFFASRNAEACSVLGSFRDLGFWKSPGTTFCLRALYPRFDGFLANSRAVALHYHREDGVPIGRIGVIHNGVDMPGIGSRPERNGGEYIVGIVANLNRRVKRVDLFLHAARRVAARFPAVRFVVIGDGPLRRELEDLAGSLGLRERVRFLGELSDPGSVVATFDAGVVCSDSEGFSNAILEYMGRAVPVVASASGGNVELVAHGRTGLLFEPGNAEQLADSLGEVLADERRAAAVGLAGREVVARSFAWRRCVERHEEAYEAIFEGRAFPFTETTTRAGGLNDGIVASSTPGV